MFTCKFTRHALPVAVAVLLFAGTLRSDAFVNDGDKWTLNRTVVMHLSLGGARQLQDGFNSFNQSAADALQIWNEHLVHMRFASVLASPLPPADGDADNSVFFASNVFGDTFGSSTLAITLSSTRGNVITETDVIFNNAKSWNSYRGPVQAQAQDFHRVALHEFGHVLGLGHPDQEGQSVAAIMNSTVGNVDSLRADDVAGARSLYDAGPAYLSSVAAPTLRNLSTRAFINTGERVLIGGFIVQGTQPATVILRAIGHSLAARGINNALTDPKIELRDAAGALVAENDDWISGADAETIASYGLDPQNSRESAVFGTLNPGDYTVIMSAFDNGDGDLSGTGLVELYDLHTTNGRAGNIASRGQVLTGNDVLIAGFIVGGSGPKELIVRGLGPSLVDAGIANSLSDPTVQLVNSSGTPVGFNDDWESDPNAQKVRDKNLAPSRGNESALYANVSPGTYTAVLRGFNNATGIGLVEVYDLSPAP